MSCLNTSNLEFTKCLNSERVSSHIDDEQVGFVSDFILLLFRLRVVDDLASRLSRKRTEEKHAQTRAARFQVNPENTDKWRDAMEKTGSFSLLDKLMSEIPGKDNYPANITDGVLGQEAYSMDPEQDGQKLNAGYYHRRYKVLEKGAMGIQTRHRGFSDPNLFVAMTTQENVAGIYPKQIAGTQAKRSRKL